MTFKTCARVVAIAAAFAAGQAASADIVSFAYSGSLPSGHAAAATFTLNDVANTVTIRIENTISAANNGLESRSLTGLFWDMSTGALPFTGVSATHGGDVNNPSGYSPTQIWAFSGSFTPASTPFGTQFGLGAAGFGAFGPSDLLAPGGPPPQPNGLDGGILSATGNAYSGQNQNPMYRSFIQFAFSVNSAFFAGGIHNIAIANVGWQFGSDFNEPGIVLIPLPAGAWIGIAGLAGVMGMGVLRRRALQRTH